MSSRGKKKTTFAKLNREARLRERRQEKQAKKQARRDAPDSVAAEPASTDWYGQPPPSTDDAR